LSSLVMTVPSMPKDVPISNRPITTISRSLISVTTGIPESSVAATGPNSGREPRSNSTTSWRRSSSRACAKPSRSSRGSSGWKPIVLILRRSLFQGFFQTEGNM
jgi:hypothetical protein